MTWHVLDIDGAVGTGPVLARLAEDPQRAVVLVRRADGTLRATDPGCPHLGHPLSMGRVEEDVLECDHHAYRYRLSDGTCVVPGGPLAGVLPLHDVREVDDRLEVRLAPTATA